MGTRPGYFFFPSFQIFCFFQRGRYEGVGLFPGENERKGEGMGILSLYLDSEKLKGS